MSFVESSFVERELLSDAPSSPYGWTALCTADAGVPAAQR